MPIEINNVKKCHVLKKKSRILSSLLPSHPLIWVWSNLLYIHTYTHVYICVYLYNPDLDTFREVREHLLIVVAAVSCCFRRRTAALNGHWCRRHTGVGQHPVTVLVSHVIDVHHLAVDSGVTVVSGHCAVFGAHLGPALRIRHTTNGHRRRQKYSGKNMQIWRTPNKQQCTQGPNTVKRHRGDVQYRRFEPVAYPGFFLGREWLISDKFHNPLWFTYL